MLVHILNQIIIAMQFQLIACSIVYEQIELDLLI
jgi:hypothetical protein